MDKKKKRFMRKKAPIGQQRHIPSKGPFEKLFNEQEQEWYDKFQRSLYQNDHRRMLKDNPAYDKKMKQELDRESHRRRIDIMCSYTDDLDNNASDEFDRKIQLQNNLNVQEQSGQVLKEVLATFCDDSGLDLRKVLSFLKDVLFIIHLEKTNIKKVTKSNKKGD